MFVEAVRATGVDGRPPAYEWTAGNPWIEMHNCRLSIAGSVATVEGWTYNLAAKIEVLRILARSSGISRVCDRIKVLDADDTPSVAVYAWAAPLASPVSGISRQDKSASRAMPLGVLEALAVFVGLVPRNR